MTTEDLPIDVLAKKKATVVAYTSNDLTVNTDVSLLKTDFNQEIMDRLVYKAPKPTQDDNLSLFVLPKYSEEHMYGLVEIRIPFSQLSFSKNEAVQRNAVWGTDLYTDDSDIVCAIVHSGFYIPFDHPHTQTTPQPETLVSFTTDKDGNYKIPEKCIFGHENARTGQCLNDLLVTVRIMPKLIRYSPSYRHGIHSKGWGIDHDGVSFRIESVKILTELE